MTFWGRNSRNSSFSLSMPKEMIRSREPFPRILIEKSVQSRPVRWIRKASEVHNPVEAMRLKSTGSRCSEQRRAL